MNDPTGPAWQRLNHSALLRFLLLLACGWAVVQLIDYFRAVLTLFIAAAVLAVLLDYPVRRLVRLGCSRALAILLTLLGGLAVASVFVAVLGFQLINQGSSLLNDLVLGLQRPDLPFHNYLKTIEIPQVLELLRSSLGTGLGVIGGAFTNVFGGVFLLVIVAYMLIDNGTTWSQAAASAAGKCAWTLRSQRPEERPGVSARPDHPDDLPQRGQLAGVRPVGGEVLPGAGDLGGGA
jgi:predicted PurR-regulated permease PerM